MVIHYKDGRTLQMDLSRLPVNYRNQTYDQYKKQMNDLTDEAHRTGKLAPDVRIVGSARIQPLPSPPKVEYYRVGDYVMPFNAQTHELMLNKQTTPNLVDSKTQIKVYEQVTTQLVEIATLVYIFSGRIKAMGGRMNQMQSKPNFNTYEVNGKTK
jgi:hypothetical protein